MDVKMNLDFLKDLEKDNGIKIDSIKLQKMLLLFNAIEDGWSVKKKTIRMSSPKIMKTKRKCLRTLIC